MREKFACVRRRCVIEPHPANSMRSGRIPLAKSHLSYVAGTSVLLDGSWTIDPSVTHGTLVLGPSEVGPHGKPFAGLRAAVISVRSEDGTELATLDPTR